MSDLSAIVFEDFRFDRRDSFLFRFLTHQSIHLHLARVLRLDRPPSACLMDVSFWSMPHLSCSSVGGSAHVGALHLPMQQPLDYIFFYSIEMRGLHLVLFCYFFLSHSFTLSFTFLLSFYARLLILFPPFLVSCILH